MQYENIPLGLKIKNNLNFINRYNLKGFKTLSCHL